MMTINLSQLFNTPVISPMMLKTKRLSSVQFCGSKWHCSFTCFFLMLLPTHPAKAETLWILLVNTFRFRQFPNKLTLDICNGFKNQASKC